MLSRAGVHAMGCVGLSHGSHLDTGTPQALLCKWAHQPSTVTTSVRILCIHTPPAKAIHG